MATIEQPDTQIDRLLSIFSERGRDLSAARNMIVGYFANIDGLHTFLSSQEVHQDLATPTKTLICSIESGESWAKEHYFDVVTQTPSFEAATTVGDAIAQMCVRSELDQDFVDSIINRGEGYLAPITALHPTATRRRFYDGVDVPLTVLTNQLTIYQTPDLVIN